MKEYWCYVRSPRGKEKNLWAGYLRQEPASGYREIVFHAGDDREATDVLYRYFGGKSGKPIQGLWCLSRCVPVGGETQGSQNEPDAPTALLEPHTGKPKLVGYYRISTQQQRDAALRHGLSYLSLGHAAQQERARHYAQANGYDVAKEYEEIESGRNPQRPKLLAAVQYCKAYGCKLYIAEIDRAARKLRTLLEIVEVLGIDNVIFGNVPDYGGMSTAHKMYLIQQMGAMAELESAMISERTKSRLAILKATGFPVGKLGNQRMREKMAKEGRLSTICKEAGKRGGEVRRESAAPWKRQMFQIIEPLRTKAGMTLLEIASELNRRGYKTYRGNDWVPARVSEIIKGK